VKATRPMNKQLVRISKRFDSMTGGGGKRIFEVGDAIIMLRMREMRGGQNGQIHKIYSNSHRNSFGLAFSSALVVSD